jgi:hypothetical protein
MRRVIAIAILCALQLPASALAQQPKTIPREQSKVVLSMPGLDGAREIYQYVGWTPDYSRETSYGAQYPARGQYPRAQLYLNTLAPGHMWTVTRDMDEKTLRSAFPFFKDKTIKIDQPARGGTDEKARTMRFTVDAVECIGFSVVQGSLSSGIGQSAVGAEVSPSVTGFYCATAGQKISDADVSAILSGWRFVPHPSGPTAAGSAKPAQ